ncbi:MAG TPA: glycosyltransferase, partial [Thermoanaerobaculia bacterium]|nr:glycosyltransferase [Thermoanaerobaculia bacterium]
MDVSVVVPFYRRHDNLERCLAGLSLQEGASFEVLVCAFRPDARLEAICRAHPCVRVEPVGGEDWNVSRSRNAGLRAAAGDLVLFLDADVVARPELLALHRAWQADGHARGDAQCVTAGRVLGFAPYESEPAAALEVLRRSVPELLAGAEALLESDPRWQLAARPLPWALCWSGNLSVPRRWALERKLFFDPGFQGWGGEDLEWAYRACRSGCRVELCPEAWGVHLPHPRPVSAMVASERENFRRFLRAHPSFEVEIVVWLNDLEANRRFDSLVQEIAAARGLPPADAVRSLRLA